MYRIIKANTPIFGMAYERKKVIQRLEGFSKRILEHVAKCILYGRRSLNYDHWIEDEIALWISDASDMFLDKGKKLKSNDYRRYLFGEFGDEVADARTNLHVQYADDRKTRDPYPATEIDKQKIYNMFDACEQIKDIFCDKLATKQAISKEQAASILHNILDKFA